MKAQSVVHNSLPLVPEISLNGVENEDDDIGQSESESALDVGYFIRNDCGRTS
jgi:hypothetical protein